MNDENTFDRTVFICSPYRPLSSDPMTRAKELQVNVRLARKGCEIARTHGFLPLAPPLYFTQFLDDEVSEERATGIAMRLRWMESCDELWAMSKGISGQKVRGHGPD